MTCSFNKNQISVLMDKNSLTELTKNNITMKINNLIQLINNLHSSKKKNLNKEQLQSLYSSLLLEQKATARSIVNKNNDLSKKLIKSMAYQKENLLQMLEINQLHLEAELKNLNSKLNYPAVKTQTSFASKFFSLFKPAAKNTISVKGIRKEIAITTAKLSNLEKQKEKLSKEFGDAGVNSLKYLNKITYNSFLPAEKISSSSIKTVKSKLSFIK